MSSPLTLADNIDNLTLAKNLDNLMLNARLSASELGRRLNIPAVTIMKVRNGEVTNPTIATLLPIASYFGLTISQLIGEELKAPNMELLTLPLNSTDKDIIKVPILSWEQAGSWPNTQNMAHHHYKVAGYYLNSSVFAISIDSDEYGTFPKGGVIIIDPQENNYRNNDYVVVTKVGQQRPTIKRIIEEDGNIFLQSLILISSKPVEISPEYNITGVILAYKKWFKH